MQNTTTTLPKDQHRQRSCQKQLQGLAGPKPTQGSCRDSSMVNQREKGKDQEVVNLYDRRALKESKELMQKIEQMKNRLTYIDREGDKNKAQMKVKQQRLNYIKESKEKASEWVDHLTEAKGKQKKEQRELRRKVSSTANQIAENVYKSRQKLLEARSMNYRQMKLDKELARQRLEEAEQKELEEKKLKARRLASSKRNSLLGSSVSIMPSSTQRSGSIQWFKPIKKQVKEKENEPTLSSMQKELEHLVQLEQQKLEQLQSIIKEKKAVEEDYNGVLHLKGSELDQQPK